jgi:hypothetical protein
MVNIVINNDINNSVVELNVPVQIAYELAD